MLDTSGNKEARSRLSPTNAKALNTMRQRLKKHNIPYQDAIDKLKEQPDLPTESEQSESSSSSSEDSDSDSDGASVDADKVCMHAFITLPNDLKAKLNVPPPFPHPLLFSACNADVARL